MIQASPAYLAANAKLNKVPVFLIVIEGYARAFCNHDIGGTFHQDLTLEVPETAGPWEVGAALNPAFDYDNGIPGSGSPPPFRPHDFTPPVVYPKFFVAGETVNLDIQSASLNIFGNPAPTGGVYPLSYVAPFSSDPLPGTAQAGHLMGAWCDLLGRVVQPIYIAGGAGVVTLTCPAGASTLQLGINDRRYDDNTGSWVIGLGAVDSVIVPCHGYHWDLSVAVNELQGGANHQGYSFNVQDHDGLITADFPGFTFEGKKITLLQGFLGLAVADFVTLFTGTIDTVASANGNLEYTFACIDALQNELAKSIFRFADDGFETSDKHVRTLNAHPLDILLQALTNELGLPASRIDLAKIQRFRDTVFAKTQYYFRIKSPPACKDWLQSEICKPLGAYLWTNNLGQVSLNFFYPLSLEPVATLDSDTLTEVPLEEQADHVNQVDVKFDYDASDKPLADSVTIEGTSLVRYGPSPLHTIEARGLRSGFQGYYLASLVSRLIFLRFAMKNAKFEDSASLLNIWSPAVLLEPGDLIALTCPFCPDRQAGVIGITNMLFEAADGTKHLENLTVGFTLLRINFKAFKQYLIAPNGEADFPGASSGDQAKYMFLANDSDQYSTGVLANTLT